MKAYERGYESVPGSSLPDDQKQVWLGRLQPGRCRVLAKMGKHEEAWTEARKVYQAVVLSRQNSIERALAYPEAKRKLAS